MSMIGDLHAQHVTPHALSVAVERALSDIVGAAERARLRVRSENRTAALEAAHAACDDADCESLHCAIGLRNRMLAAREPKGGGQ